MNFVILFRLILAHIISDFVLQFDKICAGKEKNTKTKYFYQILHSFTHAAIAYLFVADWCNWIVPLVIFVSHLLIDFVKIEFLPKNILTFVGDQIAHIAVILILWLTLFCNDFVVLQTFFTDFWSNTNFWIIATAYLLLLKPTSIFLSLFTKKWTPTAKTTNSNSLPNAGQWIGYLERVLLLTFILTGTAEGIGFLLAAKSIFRFGELSKAQEIKTTEYVLIGTLMSFTIAILLGFSVLRILK